ncbi:hypothetical protein LTR99_006736 [Exophiala xenobiotica]|uniref:F-box domain-containing protein n=1 Tax=Vermiconidia calcicola TaxID=1690605 RepID=A0AAV9Q262_9PEZI|nr:hypothetical protein LTR41_009638 [Exophiala xenobiotica]KAK5531733.1 hypothetical protein LTR25_008063 [Vermiconidia calcicola]KAK5542799.1 hypothetical protein LTR23_005409 [Chaetothyriales sp. CCFEE 6169]KAK5221437.1 hypothetical protein LTR72_006997 [Exophiala xenobiotica]KAK5232617.1 hypothetical protein LTR47_006181 [Exophiala xenobiotica]
MSLLLALPPEIRLQIWSYIVQPTVIHPCTCAEAEKAQAQAQALQRCHQAQANQVDDNNNRCQRTPSPSPLPYNYNHCDNQSQLLRVNRLVFNEVQPLFANTQRETIYMLCNNLCLDQFLSSNCHNTTETHNVSYPSTTSSKGETDEWKSESESESVKAAVRIRHLRVDLFVGWATDCRDDWFLGQSHRWAQRYVAGVLSKYEAQTYGRRRPLTRQTQTVVIEPAEEVKEDFSSVTDPTSAVLLAAGCCHGPMMETSSNDKTTQTPLQFSVHDETLSMIYVDSLNVWGFSNSHAIHQALSGGLHENHPNGHQNE